MNIIKKYPPNYREIEKVFDLEGLRPVFTWGSEIYNPHDVPVSEDLMVHEEVHEARQGKDPQAWWDKYLVDPEFRLKEEVEAYGMQYKFIRAKTSVKVQAMVLASFGRILASKLYGEIIDQAVAESKIRNAAKYTIG